MQYRSERSLQTTQMKGSCSLASVLWTVYKEDFLPQNNPQTSLMSAIQPPVPVSVVESALRPLFIGTILAAMYVRT